MRLKKVPRSYCRGCKWFCTINWSIAGVAIIVNKIESLHNKCKVANI